MLPVTPRIATIMRLSKWLSYALAVVLVLMPTLVIAAIVASRIYGGEVMVGGPRPVNFAVLPSEAALFSALVITIDLTLRLLPVFFLQRLFWRWSRGTILEAGAAHLIKLAGIVMLISGLAATILSPALGIVSTQNLYESDLSITFELETVLVAIVIYLVGMALAEAAKVAKEAELTI